MSETNETPQTGIPGKVGALLAAARVEQGMSVSDVAQQMKLSIHQIEALEADDYASLPGHIFVRGFIRNYAKLLQLDASPLLTAAEGVFAAMPAPDDSPTVKTIPFPANKIQTWQKLGVGLAAVAGMLWLYQALREPSDTKVVTKVEQVTEGQPVAVDAAAPPVSPAPVAVAETPVPMPRAPASDEPPATAPVAKVAPSTSKIVPEPMPITVAPVAPNHKTTEAAAKPPVVSAPLRPAPEPKMAAPVSTEAVKSNAAEVNKTSLKDAQLARYAVHLYFEQDSWIEVKASDGRVIYSRHHVPAGTRQGVRVTLPFTLAIGNAAGVKVEFKGRPLDLAPYTQGNVVRMTVEK